MDHRQEKSLCRLARMGEIIYWSIFVFFFFSSRRRHTRFDCDWSSDVCSSDLGDSAEEQSRKATILWTTAELLRIVTVLAHPVMPSSTARVWSLLGLPGSVEAVGLDRLRWGQLAPGKPFGGKQLLFSPLGKNQAVQRTEGMANGELYPATAPPAR